MVYGKAFESVSTIWRTPRFRTPTIDRRAHPTDNFDDFWRVAAKIFPTPAPLPVVLAPPASQSVMPSRPPSADPANPPDRDGAYNVRSVPVRIYLPDGPVLQDLVPPVTEEGRLCHDFIALLQT